MFMSHYRPFLLTLPPSEASGASIKPNHCPKNPLCAYKLLWGYDFYSKGSFLPFFIWWTPLTLKITSYLTLHLFLNISARPSNISVEKLVITWLIINNSLYSYNHTHHTLVFLLFFLFFRVSFSFSSPSFSSSNICAYSRAVLCGSHEHMSLFNLN